MANRLNKSEQTSDARFVDAIRSSVDQIWQAGLGAFAKAQHEGEDLYERLVREGADVQRRTQQMAGEQLAGVPETVAKMAETVGKQAFGSWEKLESVFEDRVSRSLRKLGVPSHEDIAALSAQISDLQKSVNSLAAKKNPAKPAEKKTTAKTSAKTAAKAEKKAAAPKPVKASASKSTARTSARKASTAAASRA